MSALELDPDLAHAEYRSTELRAPKRAPLVVPMGEVEKTGPLEPGQPAAIALGNLALGA